MIVAVTERYHDYEPQSYFLDTSKLNPNNCIDEEVLKAAEDNDLNIITLFIDASNWESNPVFKGVEPHVTEQAKVKNGPAEKIIHLVINFEG